MFNVWLLGHSQTIWVYEHSNSQWWSKPLPQGICGVICGVICGTVLSFTGNVTATVQILLLLLVKSPHPATHLHLMLLPFFPCVS